MNEKDFIRKTEEFIVQSKIRIQEIEKLTAELNGYLDTLTFFISKRISIQIDPQKVK